MRLLSAAVLFVSTVALADLTLVNEAISNGKTRNVTLSAKGAKAFFEMKEVDGPTRTMLRDGDARKMYIIDHDKKVVLVITEEDSKVVEERQAAMRVQLKAQLDRLPPEQRERMEKTMLGQQVEGKVPVFTYEKKKTPARKISGFSCQDYSVKRDGQLAGEGCFTSWKDIGVTADDFKAVMLKALPSAAGNPMGAAFEASDSAPGFPVWRTHVDPEGKVTTETTLKSLTKTAVSAENFELPKDYAQKSMADSMGPPPRPVK